jgi:hypothetical protein
MWQGLKPSSFLWAFCGTIEVMPCYNEARFNGAEWQPRHSSAMKAQMRLAWGHPRLWLDYILKSKEEGRSILPVSAVTLCLG